MVELTTILILSLVIISVAIVVGMNYKNKGLATVGEQFKCQRANPPGFCLNDNVEGGCEKYDSTAKNTGFYKDACVDPDNKKETKDNICCVLDSGADPIDLITFRLEDDISSLKNHKQLELIDYPELKIDVMVPKYVYNYDTLDWTIIKPDETKIKVKCEPKDKNNEEEKIVFSECAYGRVLALTTGTYKIELLGYKENQTSALFKKELKFYVVDSTAETS